MTLVLTEQQEQLLHELSETTERSEQELAREAIDWFLEYRNDFIEAVNVGLAESERGELYTHAEVKERIWRQLAS